MRSDLQQATPQRDGDCMRPIVGLKFVHQILNMKVNSSVRNRQLIRNLLVAIAIPNEPEHLQFPGCKILFPQMLREAGRHIRWYVSLACVHRSDHVEQFIFRHALEGVS